MAPHDAPRRVRCKVSGGYGWAVERFGNKWWRIEWDEPTPHQDTARARVPSRFFEWGWSLDD